MANPLSDLFDKLMAPVAGLTGADRVAGTLTAIARAVFDGKMWRSLGWIALGLLFMTIGILLLLWKPAAALGGDVVKAVV